MAEPGPSDRQGAQATPKREPRIKLYDFRRPDKFSKEQIRTVQNLHETFARLETVSLSAATRSLVQVYVTGVDQMTYGEFMQSLPCPTTVAIFHMDPLKGMAVLEIDPSVSFSILERLFGSGLECSIPTRELTDIEHSVLEGIIVRLLGNLRESWTAMIDLHPRLAQIETNPMFAQIVPPSEMILLVSFEARIGTAVGMMNLIIPYLTIEPIISKLSAQYWYSTGLGEGDTGVRQEMLGHIGELSIPVELDVEGPRLSLRDIGELKKGSLLPVPGLDRDEFRFRMGGKRLFTMNEEAEKRGKAPIYRVVAKGEGNGLGDSEADLPRGRPIQSDPELLTAVGELKSGLETSLASISGALTSLRERQDELSDQLLLSPAGAESPLSPRRSTQTGKPFESLGRADGDHVLGFIRGELPQLIALVLSYLEPQIASRLLAKLPGELQPDVARRIACMDSVLPEVLREVERVLERKLSAMAAESYSEAGGLDALIEILNTVDRGTEKHVIETLEKESRELAEDIKKRMFVFEDITVLERESAAKVLLRVDAELLLRAMKATPDEVSDFIWGCLPGAAVAELKKRFGELGRVRLSEVEAAQQRIVALIREMEEDGEILVAPSDATLE